MKANLFLFLLLFGLSSFSVVGQTQSGSLSFSISVDQNLKSSFKQAGRLLIYISKTDKFEPRYVSVFNGQGNIFALQVENWDSNEPLALDGNSNWVGTADWDLNSIPKGKHYIQVVWDQNGDLESRSDTPGNLYSKSKEIDFQNTQSIELELSELIEPWSLEYHELVEFFAMESEILSKWWAKSMGLKASVLLPTSYDKDAERKYPVRYNVAGYGGRYTRINRLVKNEEFMDWWTSEDAPQIITVFLDGEGPFGDSYQLDSENSGPYGEALIEELIPAIEKAFRINESSQTRFVDGCSTGGWVSLALQLYYPDSFNGCWSYSPDPVTFSRMQLINIYDDENAFVNKRGHERPSMRDLYGEPMFTIKEEITEENVVGRSNTFVTSGGQWGAWNALYSPKGEDGLPMTIFDPHDGMINKDVAEHWKKYDLLLHTSSNWTDLGPKIEGKINVWMGDMDNFYLNNAMREFDDYMKNTSNPVSDARIEFSPMKGHCSNYSHKKILEEIQEKLDKM